MELMQDIDQLPPHEAFAALRDTADAALVDVRTRAELAFVGGPAPEALGRPLAWVEWVRFPSGEPNPRFIDELEAAFQGRLPGRLFFICRSGSRSLAAARHVAERTRREGRAVSCTNIAEGFEGDPDHEGHRGTVNGWKAAGLPWRQG